MNEPKLIINTSLNNRGEKTASTKQKQKQNSDRSYLFSCTCMFRSSSYMYSQSYMQYYDE